MGDGVTAGEQGAPGASVTFRNAAFGYGRRLALEGLDGAIEAGDLLAVVGPNGAGKSTLLRGILGAAARLRGEVAIRGCAARDVAYLPQQPEIDRSFPITVGEFAGIGLWSELGSWGRVGKAEAARVAGALERVGLAKNRDSLIGALSGGQMQRLLFARTLLQEAPLVLLDEPFTAVDNATAADLMGVVRDWRRAGRTVVAALHDLHQVRAEFPRTLVLATRPVAWGPTAEALAPENLARAGGICHHAHAPIGEAAP